LHVKVAPPIKTPTWNAQFPPTKFENDLQQWELAATLASSTRASCTSCTTILTRTPNVERPGLGWTLVREIVWANLERWKVALVTIKICSGKPTEEDVKALRASTDTKVDDGSLSNWYVLTRKNQGSALRVLQSGYFNGTVEAVDSELANNFSNEWGYAIDFDNNKFRIFIGPEERHDLGCALDAVSDTMFDDNWIEAFNSNENEKRARESEDDGS
jgi:hypothetical protein